MLDVWMVMMLEQVFVAQAGLRVWTVDPTPQL